MCHRGPIPLFRFIIFTADAAELDKLYYITYNYYYLMSPFEVCVQIDRFMSEN